MIRYPSSPWTGCPRRLQTAPVDEEVIPILRVGDAQRAVGWYRRLGFAHEWEHRFEPHLPAFVSVARGGVRLFLSEHTGDARPDTLLSCGSPTSTPWPPSSACRSSRRRGPARSS